MEEQDQIISISDNTTSINSIRSTISEYDKTPLEKNKNLNENEINNHCEVSNTKNNLN